MLPTDLHNENKVDVLCSFRLALLLEKQSYLQLGSCWYLLTQIEYDGFRKRTKYHCSILLGAF